MEFMYNPPPESLLPMPSSKPATTVYPSAPGLEIYGWTKSNAARDTVLGILYSVSYFNSHFYIENINKNLKNISLFFKSHWEHLFGVNKSIILKGCVTIITSLLYSFHSIGSLGRSFDEDGVENVTLINSAFSGSDNGLRIKTWARPSKGFVRNINFRNIVMKNVENPIIIDQNYCPNNQGCPSQVNILSFILITLCFLDTINLYLIF